MKHIDFNVNNVVRVKLNDAGRTYLEAAHVAFWARLGRPAPYDFKLPDEDAEGWSRWQLWSFMEHFGPATSLGASLLFDAVIQFEVPA